MPGGAEDLEALLMLLGAITHVGEPAVPRMPRSQPVHQGVAHRLGQDGGGGDGLAQGIAVDQRLVGIPDLGKRQRCPPAS